MKHVVCTYLMITPADYFNLKTVTILNHATLLCLDTTKTCISMYEYESPSINEIKKGFR